MYVLASNMWLQKIFRTLFFVLDKVVYNLIPSIYDLLITIARTSVLTQGDIAQMADRIYKLLTVFMIFKVTFSLIMYVVNPDDFSDKSKGLSKLGSNVVLSLLILVLTPYVFNYAYRLQTIILEDNSLANLVFGDTSNKSFFNSAGDNMAFMIMSPFFTPNLSLMELQDCSDMVIIDEYGNRKFNNECSGINDDGTGNENGKGMFALTKTGGDFEDTYLRNYVAGVEAGSLGLTFRLDMAVATAKINEEQEFVMDYKLFFSTAVGVVMLLLLISFCMDVALRSIKLAFLQLIAPIPIISYVDPKSGKDGLFKKWYQMCFKTFLSLFVRLLALYFAVYIISKVADLKMVDIITGSYVTNGFVAIFIIIGALMFAKQLPKILEGLGIKLDGDGKFFLNPLKKFEDQAVGGKRITGAAGALTAGLTDRVARVASAPNAKGKLKALAGAPIGILGAAKRGFSSNAGFAGGMDRQSQVNRRLRESRVKGLSPLSSYLDYAGSKFGLDNATLEKEGFLTRQNRDNIEESKRKVDSLNRQNNLNIEAEKKSQTIRKNTQEKFSGTKKQGDRLLDMADKFASTKADLGVEQKELNYLNMLKQNKGKMFQGRLIDDEMIARTEQRVNRKQYTSNRNANEANVQMLVNNNGGQLTSTFMIGDEIFRAGDTIDGNMIARAKAAEGKYKKQSLKEVTNELAKGDQSGFYSGNESDVDSFTNIYSEFENSVKESNDAIGVYNGEYNGNFETIDSTIAADPGVKTIFDRIKKTVGLMETGDAVTDVNTELSTSQSKIEKWERENEKNRQSITTEYFDEDGTRHQISTDEAESLNKPREEAHKRNIDKHQERLSTAQTIASNSASKK